MKEAQRELENMRFEMKKQRGKANVPFDIQKKIIPTPEGMFMIV